MASEAPEKLTCIFFNPAEDDDDLGRLARHLGECFGDSIEIFETAAADAAISAATACLDRSAVFLNFSSESARIWSILDRLYACVQIRTIALGTSCDRETVSRLAHHGAGYFPIPQPQEAVVKLVADLLAPPAQSAPPSPTEGSIRQIGSLEIASQRRILNRVLRDLPALETEAMLALLERACEIATYSSTISASKSGAGTRYFLKISEVEDGIKRRRSSPLGDEDPRVLQAGLPEPEPPVPPQAGDSQPARILCADDRIGDLSLFFQMRMLLEKCSPLPSEIIYASDGLEALEALKLNPNIQIALLDLDMPGTDGWQVLERLRAYPSIRRAVVSGGFTREQVARAARYGAAFFPKPCNLKSLALLASRWLRPQIAIADRDREDAFVRELARLDAAARHEIFYQVVRQQPPATAAETYRQLEAAELIESLAEGRIAAGKVSGITYYYLKWNYLEDGKKKVRSVCLGKDHPALLEDPRLSGRISAGLGKGNGRRRQQ